MEELGRIHIVQNQYSLNRAGHKRRRVHIDRYTELRESCFGNLVSQEDEIIPTSEDIEQTIDALSKQYQSGDVLALLMGDGGFHDITNGISRFAPTSPLSKARLLVLDGGFANDGARQLNPKRALEKPSAILKSGQTVDFTPLQWQFENSDEQETHLANLYGSIGVTALVAYAINQEHNRNWAGDNWLKKAWITRSVASKAPTTPVSTSTRQEAYNTFDVGFSNGSHMSGFADAFPVSLEEPRSFQYEVPDDNYIAAGLRLALGRTAGAYCEQPFEINLPEGGYVQLDGEAWPLRKSTKVAVTSSDEKFTVYATRSSA